MKPLCRLASRSIAVIRPAATRRALSTAHRPTANPHLSRAQIKPLFTPSLQLFCRRSYADAVSPPTKRRGRGFFRWTWRLTYLSALGGIGYLAYGIYLLRTPHEQLEADPSKKKLVILGSYFGNDFCMLPLTGIRHRLGRCIAPQETVLFKDFLSNLCLI